MIKKLTTVLLGALLATVIPLGAAEAAPKRSNPAWTWRCYFKVSAPYPYVRPAIVVRKTCVLVHSAPGRGR